MLDLISQLVAAKAYVQENPGAQVTVSLPLDDPRAQKLLSFAKKLMIPTVKIRASGLTTRTGIDNPGNAEEFLAALRQALGDELYCDLMQDLGGQLALLRDKQTESITSDPGFLSRAVHDMGQEGLLAEMPNRQKLVNVADDVLRKIP